jgi:hypothetical protein
MMPKRFIVLMFVLAALVTAATFFYATEIKETLSDPGLADTVREATVHGWPWGYYAEVTELTPRSERYVAVFEYTDLRWQMLGQTFLAWFVVSLILVAVVVIFATPAQR